MIRAALLGLILSAGAAVAQDQEIVIDAAAALDAPGGALLRGLDRINGVTTDIAVLPGETVAYERLEITLSECRYPRGKEQVEGFAYLSIKDIREDAPSFEGWMFASSPALSALDHPRYDVWVISCITES